LLYYSLLYTTPTPAVTLFNSFSCTPCLIQPLPRCLAGLHTTTPCFGVSLGFSLGVALGVALESLLGLLNPGVALELLLGYLTLTLLNPGVTLGSLLGLLNPGVTLGLFLGYSWVTLGLLLGCSWVA
jgi:hypothetical protein